MTLSRWWRCTGDWMRSGHTWTSPKQFFPLLEREEHEVSGAEASQTPFTPKCQLLKSLRVTCLGNQSLRAE